MGTVKVMVVDESALVRHVLAEQLSMEPGIEVIAVAPDPVFALKHLEHRWPDVFIVDIAMTGRDGIAFLEDIVRERRAAVVIFTALTGDDPWAARVRKCGVTDVIEKPGIGLHAYLQNERKLFIDAVYKAALVNPVSDKD